MLQIVPSDRAVPIRRAKGSTVTFINQLTTDVYLDSDYSRLNATADGAVPQGTKLAAGGGQIQITNYPEVYYLRAATTTFIEVQP